MEDYPVKSKVYALLHFFMSSNYSKSTSLGSLLSCTFWLKADQRAAKPQKPLRLRTFHTLWKRFLTP